MLGKDDVYYRVLYYFRVTGDVYHDKNSGLCVDILQVFIYEYTCETQRVNLNTKSFP